MKRQEVKSERRQENIRRNLPLFIFYLATLSALIGYTLMLNKQYEDMRQDIITTDYLPGSFRQKYMKPSESFQSIKEQKEQNKGVK